MCIDFTKILYIINTKESMDKLYFANTIEQIWKQPQPIRIPPQLTIDPQQLEIISIMSPYIVKQTIDWHRIQTYITHFKTGKLGRIQQIQALLVIIKKMVFSSSCPNVRKILGDCYEILNQTESINQFSELFLDVQIMMRRLVKTNDQYLFSSLCRVRFLEADNFLRLLHRLVDINQKLDIGENQIEELRDIFLEKVRQFAKSAKISKKQTQKFFKLISTLITDYKYSVNPLYKISNCLLTEQFSKYFLTICEKANKYSQIYFWLQFVVKRDPKNSGAIDVLTYILNNNSQNLEKTKILQVLRNSKQFAQLCAQEYFQLSKAYSCIQFRNSSFKIDSPEAYRIQKQLLTSRYGVWIFIELADAGKWPDGMFFKLIDNVNYLGILDDSYLDDQQIITKSSELLKKLIDNYQCLQQQIPFLDP